MNVLSFLGFIFIFVLAVIGAVHVGVWIADVLTPAPRASSPDDFMRSDYFGETYICEDCGVESPPDARIPFMTEWQCYRCFEEKNSVIDMRIRTPLSVRAERNSNNHAATDYAS